MRIPIVFSFALGLLAFALVGTVQAQIAGPTVTMVAVASDPGSDGGYAIGDTIDVALTFSQAVTVTGAPQLTLDVGGQQRQALYSEGSSTTRLVFSYTVASGDEDTNGFAVVANSLALNGGTIRADNVDATLTHAALQAGGHKVDGIAPTVTVGGETRTYVPPDRQFYVAFYFSERVYGLTNSDITVTNGAAYDIAAPRPWGATWSRYTRWGAVVEPASEGPVTVTLQAGAGADAYGNTNSAPDMALSVIAADPVTVEVTRTTSGFEEGGTAEFTVTRSRDNGVIPVSLSLDQTGDLLSGTVEVYPPPDPANSNAPVTPQEVSFTETPFALNVTFEAGETSKRITVPTVDDRWVEEDGTATLSVPIKADQYKYIPGPADSATSEVRDNDVLPMVSAYWRPSIQPYTTTQLDTGREGGYISIAYLRSADNGPLTVSLSITDPADLLDLDSSRSSGYVVESDGTLRLDFAEGSRYKSITIPVRDDDTVGPGGSVTIAILPDSDGQYTANSTRSSITVPIADDDSPLSVTLEAPAEVVEGEQVSYTLARAWDVSGSLDELTVNLRLEQTGDYVTWPQGIAPDANGMVDIPVTFANRALTATLALDTDDDEVSEVNGQLSARLLASSDNSYTAGSVSPQTTVLKDNEGPEISVEAVAAEITEGANAQYRITRVGDTTAATRVGLYVTGLPKIMTDATEAIVLTSDRENHSERLTLYGTWVDYILEFAAGETVKTLSFSTEADSVNEGDGWLAVSILRQTSAPYSVRTGRAQVHVVDDDIPTVSLTRPVGPTDLTLSADGTTWEGKIDEGTAYSYSASCTGGVSEFSNIPGTLLAPLTENVFYANHPGLYSEAAQSELGYNISNILPVGGNCSGSTYTNHTHRFYVGPEDGVLEIRLFPPGELIPIPGRPGYYQTALFAEHRSQYAVAAMAAEAAGTLITETNIFAPLTIARFNPRFTCGDTSLEYCPQYRVGTVDKIRLTVINRDPTILIKAETGSVTEGQPARFVLERQWARDLLEADAPLSETVVYLRAFQDGRYIIGDLPATVTFGRNETRKVIEFETVDDGAFGADGSVTIELLPDTSTGRVNLQGKYTIWRSWLGHTPAGGRSDRATVTITNNDEKPGITIAPSAITEGDPGQVGMVFNLSLARVVSEPVTVSYATANGTATAGMDYTAVTNGRVTIPAGATNATFSVSVLDDTINEADENFLVTISLPETDREGGHPVAITGGSTATALGVIRDNDPAVITVAPMHESVVEGKEAVFVLSRAGFTGDALSVQVRLDARGRVQILPAVFVAGAANAELSVATPDNDLVDYPPTRAYTVEVLGDGSGHNGADRVYTPGEPSTATVTVTDNDDLQVVTIHPTEPFVAEGGEVTIIFRRTGDTSEALPIVFYRAHGSAGNSFEFPDFTRVELNESSFAADESEFTFSGFFECIGDLFCDDDIATPTYPYVFLFQIYGDGGRYGLHRVWEAGNPDTATIVFYDDDRTRALELQAEYPNSGEVGETVRVNFTVLNSGSEATGDTITVSSVHRAGNDRNEMKPAEPRVGCTITGPLASGETGTCQATFVLTTQDLMDSPMTLDSTATDGTATSSPVRVLIRVLNGVAIGFTETTRLSVTEPEYGEANAQAVLRVMRVGESNEEVQVAYTLEPVRTRNRAYAADVGVDYVDNSATPGVITFKNGDTEKNITIDILGDEIEEQREQFRVTLHPPHGVRTLEGKGSRVVAITDSTPPGKSYKPTAGIILVSPDPTPESAGSIDFAVVLDRVWGEDARFEIELDAHNNLTATPAFPRLGRTGDFEDPNGIIRVTIPAGQTRIEFSLALYDDDLREEDETFQLLLGSSINRHLRLIGENDQVLVTIADDDFVEPSEINLALTHANAAFESATEGSAQRDITVTATFPGIRWPSDAADAPLRPAEPRTVDTVVRVQVDAANSTAGETDLEQFQASDAQGMFRQVEFLDVVIPAGQTSGATKLRIKPTDDAVDENDETVVLLGTEVVGTDSDAQLPVTSASFSIVDDDTRGITLTPEGLHLLRRIYMDENATYTYTMVLDSEPTEPVTIAVRPKLVGSFLSMNPATLTFTASNWNAPQEIEVTALEDGSKDARVVFVDITHEVSGGDYDDVTTKDISVGIRDTTQAYIYLDDAQASESDGHIEFTVSVRPAIYASSVFVRFATVDGTAVAGTDYTRELDEGNSYKLFTVPSGGSGTIRIPIADDQVYESPDKTFSLQLTLHNERALLEGGAPSLTATGTIRDDDPKPVVSVAGPAGAVSYVSENAKGPVTFTLTLTGQSEEDVTVSYATGGAALARLMRRNTPDQALAAATAGMDFTATTGSIVFSTGETTKRVPVQVTDDDLSEVTEFFGLSIRNPVNAEIRNSATEQTADVGLLDDDPRGVTIDPISINLREPASGQMADSSSYAVELDSSPTDAVTVTIGGVSSAVSLSGNTLSNTNTLTFTESNWDTAQTVTVTPVKDANGTSETVTLTHVPMGGDYTGIAADSVTVNVTDSDVRDIALSPVSLSLTEGEEPGVSYTVKLSTQPTGAVSVVIGGHAGTALTISGNTLASDQLTFTTSNWDAAQTVVVRAGHDDDDDDETETLTHTASGGDYSSITKGLSATIDDDAPETLTVSFAQSSYTVAEGGEVTVTVNLSADPEREVVVPLTTTDLDGASSADYSGVPPNVTFNSGETEQTFTFEAASDTANDDGERVRVGFSTLPTGVTAAAPYQTTVSITDDDVPSVTVSFGESDYTVAEGASVTVTVNLSADPEREVTVPLTKTEEGGASSADYSGVPPNVTFNSGETEQTFTFEAASDTANDDDEKVRVGFSTLPTGVTAVSPAQTTVSITDDDVPSVTVSFAQSDYTVAEGASVTVTVEISTDPEREVTVPLTKTEVGGASSADYSGVPPNVTFASGETEQTFTFEAAEDTANDDGERVRVGFSTLPTGVTAAAPYQTTVSITDDDVPSVTVSFGESDYTVAEGASVTVTVELSADPEREVTVPLTKIEEGGASSADYSGVPPNVTFNSGETEQTFTFEAASDTANDDDEKVRLGFSTLPTGVMAGTPAQTTVSITDDDVPSVTVSFGESDYTVAEGASVTVTVNLSADPEREVVVPLTKTEVGGASSADYSGVPPNVTFASGETEQTFTFEAASDTANDDDEKVRVGFSTLPTGVMAGTPAQTTVSITDDDVPSVTVSFGESDYTVAEGASVTVTVELSADPEREVTVPLTKTEEGGASSADYSGVPPNVTFASGETEQTFTFEAASDTANDDDEKVRVGFSTLPTGVTAVSPAQTTVSITDDDVPSVTVSFAQSDYTVAEGASVTVTVELSADPEREVTVPLTKTEEGGASSADYSGVPPNVTFNSGETEQTFTFEAASDTANDDDEKVRLGFSTLPTGVTAVSPAQTTVSITDDDVPSVTVSFAQSDYTVAEGGEVTVTVNLSADPEREVVVPLTTTDLDGATSADYSGVPPNVTFNSGETEQTFTFEADEDTANDDGERVRVGFSTLPTGVTAAAPYQTTVSITDDDVPSVTVSFGESDYTVAEGASVTVTVNLSADPEREVVVPLTKTEEGGASSADYSGVPPNVTFASGETEQTFTFEADEDTANDDDEKVRVGFSTLPTGVTAVSPAQTTVSITDDDVPSVTVSFGESDYTVAEGASVTVTVELSADPEREVTVPLTKIEEGGASSADYSGVPPNVTFASGETEQTFTFEAASDTANDDDEKVRVGFSTLPTGVTAAAPNQTTVSITDDDVPSVTVSFAQSDYTVAEGASVTVTVELSADPEREVTVPLTKTEEGGASSADYSGVPPNVTFASGETEQTFTFEAASDTANDDDEKVRVGFSTLPTGVMAGTPAQTTVSITDDDVPSVTVSFGESDYTVAEGASVTVTVELSADPEREVTVPLTKTEEGGASSADYSGVPPNVTFASGETEQTFTFEAASDTANDDDEKVRVGFSTLPTGVMAGTPAQTTVSITDDDVPSVTVSFGESDYTVAEGASVTVTVELSADPEREVTVPLTKTEEGGASSADYSGVPPNVTYNSGETEQTFTFEAASDTANDDDEKVRLGFSTLPTGVTAVSPAQTTVSITDDDVPSVTVSFGESDYTVAEGRNVAVFVNLNADPERTVTIPLTTTNMDGATDGDYSAPPRVTFNSGDTAKTIIVSAEPDTVDDDDEKVRLEFGPLPTGVTAVSPAQAMVLITDDDTKGIVIDPASLTVTEGDSMGASYTVKLSSQPVGDVTVTITGHYCTNLTLSGSTLTGRRITFTPDNWDTAQTVTVKAAYDHNAIDDEVTLTHTAHRGGYSNITVDLSVSVTDDAAYPLSVQGVDPTPTRVERPDQDFPSTDDSWGFVDTSATSSGTLEETGYSGECSQDAWILRVQNNRRYRVEVVFDPMTTPNANRGGGIGFPGRGDRWDHNRDDGRSFIEFTASRDSYLLEVDSRDFMNEDSLSYFGPYTITLTVIGYDPKVNNVPDYSDENHSVGDSRAGQTNRNIWLATSFTTGPSDGGYKLEYVATNLFRRMGDSSVKAALFSDSSGSPGTKIFDFERISQITGAPYPRRDRFWAPSTAEVLAASSTYWVVLMDENSPGSGYGVASTKGGTDFRGETGWSIGSNSATYDDEADSPSWTVSSTLTAMVLEVWASTVRIEPEREGETEAVDQIAPQLKSAYVYFAAMILTFDEGLDPTSTPPPSAFTVNVNGSPLEVAGVRLSEDTVDLSLSWWVEAGDTVTLDYTAPTGETDGKLQDADGNAVASFSGQAITNHTESTTGSEQSEMSGEGEASSEGEPPAAPTNLQVFPHESGRLRATWQAPDFGPSPDGYTVQWKTATGDWQDPDQVSEMDVTNTFYVINGLEDGVEYAVRVVATSNDIDGDPSEEVTPTLQEPTPPVLQSASVDGSSLTLTFDKELDNSEFLSSGLFAVNVNGEAHSVIGVAVGQSNVVLLLSPAVVAGDAVTVDYTSPADESVSRLRDLAGNAAASFSGQSVSNETQEVDSPPPQQNSPASGAPTITGTAQVGETLSADTSAINDDDGLDRDTFRYQWLGDDADISGATGRTYTLVADEEGKTVKVRVSFTDDAGNEESLTSTATAAVAAATQAAIPEDDEEESTTPLTASAHDVPESHNGSTTITFELHFSEQIPLSYKTLLDHAFTVTGGDVVKARRLEPGSSDRNNVRWEISVTPDGNGAVTVVLPTTTDCEAEGAICIRDGRMLSNRLEISVPGPSG